jgi:hypothetical protein
MTRGCVVVATKEAGATGVLITDGESGYVYNCGDISRLGRIVSELIENKSKRELVGTVAYEKMKTLWAPETGARRLLDSMDSDFEVSYDTGPMAIW